jgi:hypothetical protein
MARYAIARDYGGSCAWPAKWASTCSVSDIIQLTTTWSTEPRVVHTVPGIIDLEGSGIASGPLTARPESSTSPKRTATLLSGQRGPCLPACGLLHVSIYVLSTIAYCSTQTLLAVEVPCRTVLKVFSAMLHML